MRIKKNSDEKEFWWEVNRIFLFLHWLSFSELLLDESAYLYFSWTDTHSPYLLKTFNLTLLKNELTTVLTAVSEGRISVAIVFFTSFPKREKKQSPQSNNNLVKCSKAFFQFYCIPLGSCLEQLMCPLCSSQTAASCFIRKVFTCMLNLHSLLLLHLFLDREFT